MEVSLSSYTEPNSLTAAYFPPKSTVSAHKSFNFVGYNCLPRQLKCTAKQLRNLGAICASVRWLLEPIGDGDSRHIGYNIAMPGPFEIASDVVTVGRVPEKADIVISVPTVSALHAQILKTEEKLLITDLDSTNGTFIDERRLQPGVVATASPGNLITFAHLALRLKEMRGLMICIIVQAILILSLGISSSDCAYPSGYGGGPDSFLGVADVPLRREVYENGEIYDITHKFTPNTPVGGSTEGIGKFLTLLLSMKNGSDYNFSEVKIRVHSGTHVDAPGHFYDNYFDAGFDVDSLDLKVLNGPALLVDVPRYKNITAEVMKSLNIPKGVKRVLFRTLNTDRRLMYKKEFDTSYAGFTTDGAQWLVDNTDIKLVGTDYLSVAAYDDATPAHLVFLKNREIILVEGLKLEDVQPGMYSAHCLPLRLVGSEGSPIRCILIN